VSSRRSSLQISLIGAGAVGTTLAVLLSRQGNHRIVSVISRDVRDARRSAKLLGCDLFSHSISDISPLTEFLLIATPDESIRNVAHAISKLRHLNFRNLQACHVSGALSSDALKPLARKGTLVFSFHPLQTFSPHNSIRRQLASMKDVSYGVEGSAAAKRFAKKLTKDLGGRMFPVPKEEKILYHIACVIASNYLIALEGLVEELVGRLGSRSGLTHFRRLIESSISNGIRLSAAKALSGPIARGSGDIVRRHLKRLGRKKDLRSLYQLLGLQTLKLAVRGTRLTREQARELKMILTNSE
jgi:predicted short-subunit dehydrogenase-like oxidoreductase (DUF2520 family)